MRHTTTAKAVMVGTLAMALAACSSVSETPAAAPEGGATLCRRRA
jgi:hypothetical protein